MMVLESRNTDNYPFRLLIWEDLGPDSPGRILASRGLGFPLQPSRHIIPFYSQYALSMRMWARSDSGVVTVVGVHRDKTKSSQDVIARVLFQPARAMHDGAGAADANAADVPINGLSVEDGGAPIVEAAPPEMLLQGKSYAEFALASFA